MTTKIDELTKKIYREGIEKAKREAELIIAKAKKEADDIISEAKKEEKAILVQAEKESAEMRRNIESELRLSAMQSISNLKQKITGLITAAMVETPVRDAFDNEFVKKLILTIVQKWSPQDPQVANIALVLSQKEETEMLKFFEHKAKEQLNAGLEIAFSPKIKRGFRIGPKDGNYFISFTDTDFENYFKNHLKSKTKQLLYGKK